MPMLSKTEENLKFIDSNDLHEYSCQKEEDLKKGHIQLGNRIIALIGSQMVLNEYRGHKNNTINLVVKKMKVLIESTNGHDETEVPQEQAQGFIEGQLKENKWATLEKKDGDKELVTEKDIPKEEDVEKMKEWADKFADTETAVVTNKSKGG